MTTTRRSFDAMAASGKYSLKKTVSHSRQDGRVDQRHYLGTVPMFVYILNLSTWFGASKFVLAIIFWSQTSNHEYLDYLALWAAMAVAGTTTGNILIGAYERWLDYAVDDTVVEETAEPLPRSEAAEQDGGFVQTASNRLTRVNYKFTRAQAVWLHQIARDGEPFPIRDGAFKDSKVWTNYTAAYPDVKEKLMDAGALDEMGKWTAAGVEWTRWLRSEV